MELCVDAAHGGEDTSSDCAKFRGEVRDILAFRRFVKTAWEDPNGVSASAVLVVTHNLVTASIDPKWNANRRQFFCVQEVLKALPDRFISDVSSVHWTAPAHGPSVPGIGFHRLVNCPMRFRRVQ